jgi:phage gp29-like protein
MQRLKKTYNMANFFSNILNRNPKITEETVRKSRHLSGEVLKPQPDRITMQMGVLRNAADTARDVYNPSWIDLHNIYKNCMTDAQVKSQAQIAVNKLISEDFNVRVNGTDSDQLTELFRRPWFDTFLSILFDAELWGYSLAEFGYIDNNGEFTGCKLFPRSNVYPHNRNIIVNQTDVCGIPYSNTNPENGELIDPAQYFLLEIGETDDIGLLELIAREVIIKSFSRRDWAEFSEKWGQPRIVVKTDAEGSDLTNMQTGVSNLARNGYAFIGLDDVIEKLEASGQGASHLIYESNISLCDNNIAKLINGQSGTGEEKAFVGSAEVSERILNDYHYSRLRRYTNVINYQLFPFLTKYGYPLAGVKGYFPSLEVCEQTKANPNSQQGDSTNDAETRRAASAVKKKALLSPW